MTGWDGKGLSIQDGKVGGWVVYYCMEMFAESLFGLVRMGGGMECSECVSLVVWQAMVALYNREGMVMK